MSIRVGTEPLATWIGRRRTPPEPAALAAVPARPGSREDLPTQAQGPAGRARATTPGAAAGRRTVPAARRPARRPGAAPRGGRRDHTPGRPPRGR
ncbi:hypothetical protein ACWF7Q_30745, partial [Streptomyces sp. NPDC054987]